LDGVKWNDGQTTNRYEQARITIMSLTITVAERSGQPSAISDQPEGSNQQSAISVKREVTVDNCLLTADR
jgi:hypothetical protein